MLPTSIFGDEHRPTREVDIFMLLAQQANDAPVEEPPEEQPPAEDPPRKDAPMKEPGEPPPAKSG